MLQTIADWFTTLHTAESAAEETDTRLATHVGQAVVLHATVVVRANEEGAQCVGAIVRVLHEAGRHGTVETACAALLPRVFGAISGDDRATRTTRSGRAPGSARSTRGKAPRSPHASRAAGRSLPAWRGRISPTGEHANGPSQAHEKREDPLRSMHPPTPFARWPWILGAEGREENSSSGAAIWCHRLSRSLSRAHAAASRTAGCGCESRASQSGTRERSRRAPAARRAFRRTP